MIWRRWGVYIRLKLHDGIYGWFLVVAAPTVPRDNYHLNSVGQNHCIVHCTECRQKLSPCRDCTVHNCMADTLPPVRVGARMRPLTDRKFLLLGVIFSRSIFMYRPAFIKCGRHQSFFTATWQSVKCSASTTVQNK